MIRIFLTADNHIGIRYKSHAKPEALASLRTEAFEGMVKTAEDERCDMLVIAGDMFDNTYLIRKAEVAAVFKILSGFSGQILLLPGNHDFISASERSGADLWDYIRSEAKNLTTRTLLTEEKPYTFEVREETAVVYPAICRSKHSAPGENALGWIKATTVDKAPGTYHVGVAHGAVEGETIDSEGRYYLMGRKELLDIPMDAWLLGHTHVPFPKLDTSAFTTGERIFNPGTHVQTDVACNTEGNCFLLELDGSEVRAKRVETGNIRFYRLKVDATAGKADSLKAAVEDAVSPIGKDAVVDVILQGAVSGDDYENRDAIIEDVLSAHSFFEATYDGAGLTRRVTRESVLSEYPESSFSGRLLIDLLENEKAAQMAYDMLREIAVT